MPLPPPTSYLHAVRLNNVPAVAGACALLLALGAVASPALAQSSPDPAARGARPTGDGVVRPITLLVQPVRGDLLRLEMQQVMEMSGSRREGAGLPDPTMGTASSRDTPAPPPVGPRRNATPTRVTIMDFYGHSLVERSDSAGSVLSATTDSLLLRSGEVGTAMRSQRVSVPDSEQATRVHVEPNGAMHMLDVAPGAGAVGATLSAMPAMLPDDAVMVGDEWDRDVAMPSLPIASYRADGVLHATFRLDSTGRGGRDAYVSVRGALRRDGSARDLPPGSRVVTAGTMRGTLVLDRVRGWIVDAYTVIDVNSEVLAMDDGGAPMALGIRITQRLRVR